MDRTDIGIIGALSKNSRTPFLQIAKRLKVSESTIRKRVANLEKNGVIRRYSLVLDTGKVGFENVALIGVDVMPEKYLDIAKKISGFSEVKYAASTTGNHMFMLQVMAKTDDELRDFSERLKKLDGVTRICPAIIKNTLKGDLQ